MVHVNHPIASTTAQQAGDVAESLPSAAAAGPAVRISSTPPSPALRAAAQAGRGEPASLELQEMRRSDELAAAEPPVTEVDAGLTTILRQYLSTEKNRTIDDGTVLKFVQEQQRQLARPEGKRDWSLARRLYLDIHGVDDAKMKQIEGGRFSGGWIGSGSLYSMAGHLMAFASVVPSLYTLTVSKDRLRENPVHYAAVSLGAQAAISVATPFVNSALQIVLVARQELMRSMGQSARSAEMQAPAYPKTAGAAKELAQKLVNSNEKMEKHDQELRTLLPGSTEWRERVARIESDGAEATELIGQAATLDHQFHVRKDVIDLNYANQLRQSHARALRVAVTLAAQLSAVAKHDVHVGGYIQVGGTLGVMAIQQFLAAPADQFDKQNKTLMATLATTRLLKAGSRDKPADALELDDLGDLKDLKSQWKGPVSVSLGQFKESLELERAYAEQELADILEMDVTGFRRMQALQDEQESGELSSEEREELVSLRGSARPIGPGDGDAYESLSAARERFDMARHELACIKKDDWLALSPASKRLLLDAVSNDKPWLLSLRTAWVRLRMPADIISQIAQRFGSQFAMVVGGSNMPLIVMGLMRYLNERSKAEGNAPVVPDSGRYAAAAILATIGALGAYGAGGPAVNKKISQRAELRKSIPRVGFQPKEIATALKSIGTAMFALPASALERRAVQTRVSRSDAKAKELREALDKMTQYVEQNETAIVQEAQQAEGEGREASQRDPDLSRLALS
ncbi:MAG: hypothetical protein ABS43_12490 [Bordetella sp. SCN 67-23]|nr:hypothetical protein [Burkholderiales bacterium]ODS73845.1 MAG: hypothetical protein ABS43_12490 [Bordetella sp. SCN 67-23]ODU80536.1 MAG: hypothetical protein ABT00_12120 [Bordetella sp. SCN 68-11]OJW92700.1 MAG: hypothetical protein BGO71_23315 [Burkholderiales bacterium 67-32]